MQILNEQEADFARPPASSDKLYMAIGEKDVIEVAHPTPTYDDSRYRILCKYLIPIVDKSNYV